MGAILKVLEHSPTFAGMVEPTVKTAKTPGERIRALYLAKGWSRSKLVKALGVAQTTIIRWENGKTEMPDDEHIDAVAAIFGVTAEWIRKGNKTAEYTVEKPEPPALREFLDNYERGRRLEAGLVVDRATSDRILGALRTHFAEGPPPAADDVNDFAAMEERRYTRPLHVVKQGDALQVEVKSHRKKPSDPKRK